MLRYVLVTVAEFHGTSNAASASVWFRLRRILFQSDDRAYRRPVRNLLAYRLERRTLSLHVGFG
jgi:hypothetical protein